MNFLLNSFWLLLMPFWKLFDIKGVLLIPLVTIVFLVNVKFLLVLGDSILLASEHLIHNASRQALIWICIYSSRCFWRSNNCYIISMRHHTTKPPKYTISQFAPNGTLPCFENTVFNNGFLWWKWLLPLTLQTKTYSHATYIHAYVYLVQHVHTTPLSLPTFYHKASHWFTQQSTRT